MMTASYAEDFLYLFIGPLLPSYLALSWLEVRDIPFVRIH
jgi:hypothetical protein